MRNTVSLGKMQKKHRIRMVVTKVFSNKIGKLRQNSREEIVVAALDFTQPCL